MDNPFEKIQLKLSDLEQLILSLKQESTRPTQTEHSEKLLTVQGASQFLNLKVETTYSKVSRREIPVMKRNGRLYFSSAELMEYLKAGRKKSHSEIEQEAQDYLSKTQKK